MGRKSGLYLVVLSVGLVVLFASMPSTHVGAQDQQGSVVGSWINTVMVNTPAGPQPLTTEFVAINPGGTFIDTLTIAHSSQNPFFTGPFAPLAVDFSDAIGTWKQVGDDSNQFAFTFKRLSGSYTFQLTNREGTVVLAASGTFSATRIRIQPLATL